MAGSWIILVWAIVGLIFLLKIPGVRDCFAKLRKMSAFGIICVVVSLGFLADVSYTKDGVRTNQAATQTSAPLQSPSLPAWWNHDPTDTDGDGIPDLWEKWTHGNPFVADSHLDRDGDGLTDLEEFWNQTDPRTADTDGDGFDDGFEVAHGMNPLVIEDFTPDEPDTNNSGLPDIWEEAGYYRSFQDTNKNGFDDLYEQYDLPAESDNNFDVLVDIYSTRSALLTWGNGESFVVLASTNTTVRLRLPFGEDTEFRLLPAPVWIDLPLGELWKSRMQVSFAPRAGQRITGNAVVSTDGLIAHKVANTESVVARFAGAPLEGMQVCTSGTSGNTSLSTDIAFGKFDVFHMDAYHDVGDVLGPFTVINTVGLIGTTFSWYSAYGDMYPPTGIESWLTLRRLPTRLNENVTVVTTAELDVSTDASVSTPVTRCPRNAFTVNFSTLNFSPHLSETCLISVTLPGCAHQNDPGWLEIEVLRETTGGDQHVAYFDMDPSTPGVNRYGDTMKLLSQGGFAWDGIARASLPLAEYEEKFTKGRRPFHLAAPPVTVGQCVPPPYYTIAVRLWDQEKNGVIVEESRRIYVPQVVQVRWMTAAESLFRTPIIHNFNGQTTRVYSADYAGDSGALMQETLRCLQSYYPQTANIRFVPLFSNDADTTKFLYIMPDIRKMDVTDGSGTKQVAYAYGMTSPNMSLQRSSSGVSDVYLGSIYDSVFELYKNFVASSTLPEPFQPPILPSQMLDAICRVAAHEVGHALGLVDTTHLDGVGNLHNPGSNDQTKMMNASIDLKWFFNPHPPVRWRMLNGQYLNFVLPTPQE